MSISVCSRKRLKEEGKKVDNDVKVEDEKAPESSKSIAAVSDSTTLETVIISTASDSVTRNDSFSNVLSQLLL